MRAMLLVAAISLQSAVMTGFSWGAETQVSTVELSAQTKKPAKKTKKIKEKVEYMRAAPSK